MIKNNKLQQYVQTIRDSRLSIYEHIEIGDPQLWIPTTELENLLNNGLINISLSGLPIRKRSKVVKEHICKILGYPIPSSFKRTQPRFTGQFFDTYVQKSNNLQIWNEELEPTRRYVLIRVNSDDLIVKVKVVTGERLALLDTTGTLTQKYQAKLNLGKNKTELITNKDTTLLNSFVKSNIEFSKTASPISYPTKGELLPIDQLFKKLSGIVGQSFEYKGSDQERNRGAELHKLVCHHLGYKNYQDNGQFPDVRHQLLEVKLQTSPTIDLGLICPDSVEALDIPKIDKYQIRHCDVRYAIFYARKEEQFVTISHLLLSTGESFFKRFSKFQGKVLIKPLWTESPENCVD